MRRAAARALSSRFASSAFSIQPSSIKTLSISITRAPYQTILPPFQRRLASNDAIERAAAAAEQSIDEPVEPETTSAAEFDASDVQPIEAREVSDPNESSNSQGSFRRPLPRDEVPPSKQLYVGNLFFDVTEEDLRREFSRFGTVVDLKIIKDPRGLSKGFGYITFLDQADSTSAREALNRQIFEGRRLTVQFASPRSQDQISRERNTLNQRSAAPPSRTLYIGNMSFDLTDQDLSKLFSGVKNVLDVRVAIDRRTGQPRGFAHADFSDIESAEIAYKKLHGKEVFGRVLRCDYSAPSSRVRTRGEGDA